METLQISFNNPLPYPPPYRSLLLCCRKRGSQHCRPSGLWYSCCHNSSIGSHCTSELYLCFL